MVQKELYKWCGRTSTSCQITEVVRLLRDFPCIIFNDGLSQSMFRLLRMLDFGGCTVFILFIHACFRHC